MAYYDIWKEVSKFAPEDWDVRQYSSHVSMECKGENHRAWYMYAHISKINLGRRNNLVVFNEFNNLFNNEDEAIEFLKVIVVCANYVKIGVEKLDESIEEVAL